MQVERSSSELSGERVRNTWVTYLLPGDNGWKRSLIPNEVLRGSFKYQSRGSQDLTVKEGLMRYQLVGVVKAHQG